MSRHQPPARRTLALTSVSLLLQACATAHTPEVWVGATFERLNRAFGDPAGILINARNNRIYAFRFDAKAQTPTSDDAPTPIAYGDATLALAATDCVILFELSGPAVIAWDWQGDGCGQRDIPLPYQYP